MTDRHLGDTIFLGTEKMPNLERCASKAVIFSQDLAESGYNLYFSGKCPELQGSTLSTNPLLSPYGPGIIFTGDKQIKIKIKFMI